MKCTAHSMADTQRLWAMSLRSILHVSRYDQLSAIQFLAPLLARSYFLLFLFIERPYSLTVSLCRLLICASALVKQESFTMQPSHTSLPLPCLWPVTSVLLDHCIAPSLAGALYNRTNLQGSEAHNPGSEKKCVGAIKNVALSQQNSFDFCLKIIGSLWRDTQNNILHCGAAPVHILHVTWWDFIKQGIWFLICFYRTWYSMVHVDISHFYLRWVLLISSRKTNLCSIKIKWN